MVMTKAEMLIALDCVRIAIEQNRVMAADAHAAVCEWGAECRQHSCTLGMFLRALGVTEIEDGFPFVSEVELLFDQQGLNDLASVVARVVYLNDRGQFDEALTELRRGIESC
jgi:hypothetical protein